MKDIFFAPKGENKQHAYHTPIEKKIDDKISSFKHFINEQIFSSILLLASTIIAVWWASKDNLKFTYENFQEIKIFFSLGSFSIQTNLLAFVNDFLMAFFFFLLGLEIKKEFIAGELSDKKIRYSVFFVALGGVIFPAIIFLLLSSDEYDLKGWGIPIATDTAFALGILSLLRKKLPDNIFTFLAAIAVVDDLCAIMVIAVFYTTSLNIFYLTIAGIIMLTLMLINLTGIRTYLPYLVLGIVLWFCIEHAHIHGTLAGILVAMSIPARPKTGPKKFAQRVDELATKLEDKETDNNDKTTVMEDIEKNEIIESIENLARKSSPPISRIKNAIEPWIVFTVIPIFALLNAGIDVSISSIKNVFSHELAYSLMLSLIFGKFIGINLSSFLVTKTGIGDLPKDINRFHILGISFLAGIGFTMSIFISELAFRSHEELTIAKMGIFAGSIISGIIGYVVLRFYKKNI